MSRTLPTTLLCAGLALTLTPARANPTSAAPPPAPAVAATDTPAAAVVRQFLAARTAGDYPGAYALLSAKSRQGMTLERFSAGSTPPRATPREIPTPVYALVVLLGDTHNVARYTFTVLGPDPADSRSVLVRADPPAGTAGRPSVTLRLLTVADPGASAPRLDTLGSLRRVAPEVFARADENMRRASSRNNLKFLTLCIVQYQQDHDERMPDADKWVDEIMPYVQDKMFFHDPSDKAGHLYSYAFNRALSHQSLAEFESPTSTVMLFESTKGVKNASDTGQSVPQPGRHLGGTDYAFADGHVKWFRAGEKLSYKLTGK